MALRFVAKRKSQILLDLLVFALALGMAWWFDWKAAELVWSLWLSSLTVGYATIVVTIGFMVLRGKPAANWPPGELSVLPRVAFGIFMMGFMTTHFFMFHLVHAVFLHGFFPLDEPGTWLATIAEYVPFVLVMAWGERKRVGKAMREFNMSGPYVNVVRMHLLIFFFVFAKFIGADHFLIFCVVYLVYFFPLKRAKPNSTPAITT